MKSVSKVPYADPVMLGKPVSINDTVVGEVVGVDKDIIVMEINNEFEDEFNKARGYSINLRT